MNMSFLKILLGIIWKGKYRGQNKNGLLKF